METPEGLTVERHLDLAGRGHRPTVRSVLLALLGLVLVVALLGVYGQKRVESTAETSSAGFTVSAPTKLRGGLFFEARFTIEARSELEDAWIVLDSGWLDDITLNTLSPAPLEEASRDGDIALRLGRVPADEQHILHLHFQVNPTAVGARSQDVRLLDGERELASLDRDLWIWP
jgi:hypothetical protein